MCWRDDVATRRVCISCGQTYYGSLGHVDCLARTRTESTWISEQWVDETMDQHNFVRAVDAEFGPGSAQFQDVLPECNPGYKLYRITIPIKRKEELQLFLKKYADEHTAIQERGTYPNV
ncbi:MAG: hypothetical protein Q8P35_00440 [Candidatus Yanofskybacteria bacterium]|nr:hypothetical protein [Candidatus Yanofskybacteria bacterium]